MSEFRWLRNFAIFCFDSVILGIISLLSVAKMSLGWKKKDEWYEGRW